MLHNQEITNNIKELIAKGGYTLRSFATKVGIDHASVSKLVAGKRKWTLSHLSQIAGACDCPLTDLLPAGRLIPIVAEIGADGQFVPSTVPLGQTPLPTILARGESLKSQFYAIRLREEFGMIPAGSIIHVRRDTPCIHRDWVVCSRETGLSMLAQVDIHEDKITLSQHGKIAATLPRTHIKLCDRVEAITLPMV